MKADRQLSYIYAGGCIANPAYMLITCRKSCGTCDVTDGEELDALIERIMELYEVGDDEGLIETLNGGSFDLTDEEEFDARHEVGGDESLLTTPYIYGVKGIFDVDTGIPLHDFKITLTERPSTQK